MIGTVAAPRLLLTLRTAATLRPSQLVWRVVRAAQRRVGVGGHPPDATPTFVTSPGVAAGLQNRLPRREADDERHRRALGFRDGVFTALGRSAPLDGIDWVARRHSHLWSYHLHYFDLVPELIRLHLAGDRNALPAVTGAIDAWITSTKGARGDGWDPYPTSIRTIEWLRLLHVVGPQLEPVTRDRIARSVYAQVRWLRSRLEWHLDGNHVLKNLCALAWGGLSFGGKNASRWRSHALRHLRREYARQVLSDGTHIERTPAYHLIALYDLLEVIALAEGTGAAVPDLRNLARRMYEAAPRLIRTGGDVLPFGDSAPGMGPSWCDVQRLAESSLPSAQPPMPSRQVCTWALPDAGFRGIEGGLGRLVADLGPFGARHQPAHGHCDALSFELEIEGRPFVVDSGVHGYEGDPFREYSRSTRAHNTVALGRREQSEVWQTFRVARRASVECLAVQDRDAEVRVVARCRPYHAPDNPHDREFLYDRASVRVTDRVAGASDGPILSYLHIHPDWRVEMDGTTAVARQGDAAVCCRWFGVEHLDLVAGARDPVQGWYFPRLGVARPAPTLVATARPGEPFGYSIERVAGS